MWRVRLQRPGELTALAGFAAVVVAALLALCLVLLPHWPPQACDSEKCKEGREWISAFFGFLVLLGGLYQFRRGQLWRRAEFLASEMKTFRAEPRVSLAMSMIDWTARRLDLLRTGSNDPKEWVAVTRSIQNRALLPHTLLGVGAAYRSVDSQEQEGLQRTSTGDEELDSGLAGYTREEVAIRDAYDGFLDGLECFSNYWANGLISVGDLRPYLGYWISDIVSRSAEASDNEWTFWLLTYIHFYQYAGVTRLFLEFGHDISVDGALFRYFSSQVKDQSLALEALEQLRAMR